MEFDFTLEPGRTLKKQEELIKQVEPQITVVTPFYNTKKELIMGTVNTVLNQTYPYFEWLIIDDGSTDEESLETLKEIEKMDNRIKVFHKENEGLAATRDYGAKKSSESAKYLLFVDDDDQFSSTFMECSYWALEANPEASWAYADSVGFGAQEYVWRKWYNPVRQKKENNLISINFIRKKDFFEVGGYELKIKNVYEDWNFWLKMIAAEKYPVRMSSLSLWYRRKNEKSGELARARQNNDLAMNIIKETASKIKKTKKAIQFPRQDYKWDTIEDEINGIIIPEYKKSKKTKILMMIPWMITGGGDKFNLDLVQNIDKDKFEFIVVSTMPNANELKQQFEEYATVYDLPAFLNRKYWPCFISYLIKKNNIDLIFNTCCQFGYSAMPYLKSKYPEIPIIDYVHMEEWYWRNGGYSRDAGAFKDLIDKTLVCNKNSEKILAQKFGKKPEEVGTVYIGVDEKKFDPEKYNKEDILKKLKVNPNGRKVISYICRITEQKRPFLLLEIVKKLKAKRNDFVVIVAGDGNLLKSVKSKAKSLKLTDNIIFLGKCTNIADIYAISDLTLNCSIKEGLALTSYESLSMGVPVISSDVGGQKELINDEVGRTVKCYQKETEINKFTYADEEVNQYIDAIEEILGDLDKYKQNCRKRILEKFVIKNMVSDMEKIFEETKNNPNQEKIENGKLLSKFNNLTKEFITNYLTLSGDEYKWLSEQFNKTNVDRDYKFEAEQNKYDYYEQTLEYKIKHPIVVVLQKIGIYEFCRKLMGKDEEDIN